MESLRSGRLFSSLLSKVQEATTASETLLSSLQREHAEQPGVAWGWITTKSSLTQNARGDSAAEWLSVRAWLSPHTRQEEHDPGFLDPRSKMGKSGSRPAMPPVGSFRSQGRTNADDFSRRELILSLASIVKLWCGELRAKDNVARIERAAHCLVYLLTNVPLDRTTAACFFQSLWEWKGRAHPSFVLDEEEEDSPAQEGRDSQQGLPGNGRGMAPSWEKEFGLSARLGGLDGCSKSGKLPQFGLSVEGEEILRTGCPLSGPILLESLLQGLDNIFQVQNFEGSAHVAEVCFHTMISLLLLVEVLLRRFLPPTASPHGGADALPPLESRPSISGSTGNDAGLNEPDRGERPTEQLEKRESPAAIVTKHEERRRENKEEAEWIRNPTLAKTCKQLLLCMSRYQAFVYKAAAPVRSGLQAKALWLREQTV